MSKWIFYLKIGFSTTTGTYIYTYFVYFRMVCVHEESQSHSLLSKHIYISRMTINYSYEKRPILKILKVTW